MTLFKNKYRIESTRLRHWDYGQAGYYYVTICTKGREAFFGEIVDNEMFLSEIGEIVADEWLKTSEIRPNVECDAWIVMPNHLHLIVVIVYKLDPNQPETRHRHVSTSRTASATEKWAGNTLGSIIGQFKSKCTKRIIAAGHENFAWQTRYYERIIRSEDSLNKARRYIQANPENWDDDSDNLAGLFM